MRIDNTAAEEALVSFEREKNAMFFDPQNGYFNTQGRNAYDAAKGTSDNLAALKKKYSEGLKSAASRDAFSRAADSHITRANADIMRHSSKQIQAWEVATINASVENTMESAMLYWNDDERLKVQNALGRQSIIDASNIEGLDGAILNERLQNFDSSFARNAISAAVNTSSQSGIESLTKYGSMLEPQDRINIESMIGKKQKAENVQQVSSRAVLIGGELVSKYGDQVNARSTINESIALIEDPELRKAASAEASRQLDLKMKAESEERAGILEAGEKYLNENGTVQQFKAQNPEQWEKLTSAQRKVLESGKPISTDFQKLSDLLLLPKNELANVNPTDYAHILAPADRAKLLGAVKSARSGGSESQAGRSQTAETSAMVKQIFGAPGQGGYKGKDAEKVNAFYSIITDEAKFREERKGGPLSAAEYTDMLGEMSRKVVKERWILPDKKTDISDISAEYMGQVSDLLRRNGTPVTGDNLIKGYERLDQLSDLLRRNGIPVTDDNLIKAYGQAIK